MRNLFKAAILAAPLMALIFYYVVLQQSKIDTEMEKESLNFEQGWNEFKAENPLVIDKRKYQQRAEQAEKAKRELEQKKKEKEQKIEEFESEFEKAFEEIDKERR